MAIKSLTYRDIPVNQRRKSATVALNRLREHLTDPTVSDDQRAKMMERAAHLESWVQGALTPAEEE